MRKRSETETIREASWGLAGPDQLDDIGYCWILKKSNKIKDPRISQWIH